MQSEDLGVAVDDGALTGCPVTELNLAPSKL